MQASSGLETIAISVLAVFIISAIIAWAYVKSLQSKMDNIKSEPTAYNYTIANSFRLNSQHDRFLFSNVTRVAKPQNNGGGHHGGGGHRGGGGHHGGGGGRR